jgi:hypothetical protein
LKKKTSNNGFYNLNICQYRETHGCEIMATLEQTSTATIIDNKTPPGGSDKSNCKKIPSIILKLQVQDVQAWHFFPLKSNFINKGRFHRMNDDSLKWKTWLSDMDLNKEMKERSVGGQ